MSYLSYQYFVLVFLLFLIYWHVPIMHRWKVLLVGSVFFLICVCSLLQTLVFFALYTICYASSRVIVGLPRGGHAPRAVFVIAVSLVVCPFTISRLCRFVGSGGVEQQWLPIGISFWTLQMVSYLADVYRGRVAACDNPAKLLLYFSFFPQVIQGPIPRYSDLYMQLVSSEHYDSGKTDLGITRILYGLFLKLMIADKIKIIADNVFAGWRNYNGFICWGAAVLYSIQLYADFKSCVEISKGISCFFGINLSPNFDRPYSSISIKEFWRRWHMSLSLWLRDYIYFPLGGSKKGKARKWGNILFVFLLSGFWHGGGGQFMVWGLMHGIYQIVEDILGTDKYDNIACLFLRRCITFTFVTIAWIMFRADCMSEGIGMFLHMIALRQGVNLNFDFWNLGLSVKQWGVLIVAIIFLIGTENFQIQNLLNHRMQESNMVVKGIVYIAVGIMLMIFGTYGYGYNAQDFIYGGF